MPVFVDQNGNYYFAAAAIAAADQVDLTCSAALVTALTAITPQKRQVQTENDGTIILSAAINVPDSAFATSPSTGNRKILTALHPTGDIVANDSFIVPDGIYRLWVDVATGGGGGGGGNATPGGGGGGGGSGCMAIGYAISVFPGELIDVVIGAGGTAGAIGAAGGNGGINTITGSISGSIFRPTPAFGGSAGASPNGGSGGFSGFGNTAGGTGGAGAGPSGVIANRAGAVGQWMFASGGAGGALTFNGGSTFNIWFAASAGGGTGGASGGGGGSGGCSMFGTNSVNQGQGGLGGNNGLAGEKPVDTTSYGAGGGGGSGNAIGGAGRPGFFRFYY